MVAAVEQVVDRLADLLVGVGVKVFGADEVDDVGMTELSRMLPRTLRLGIAVVGRKASRRVPVRHGPPRLLWPTPFSREPLASAYAQPEARGTKHGRVHYFFSGRTSSTLTSDSIS
jgi:hypothetical protein